jgi:MFS family permease
MTQVRARRGDRGGAASRNPYLGLLRTRGAVAFSATAFVARMPMAMYGLGTVLLIASLTGKYGIAGTVAAAGSVGYALCGPFIAQLADRLGQHRVLIPQTLVFAASSCAFIACAELRAPFLALLAIGGLAGASMPSTGSMVRTRWSAVVGEDAMRLHTAFALESVNDELIFVIGPALVTLLATQFVPASGIGTASLLCIAGTLLFAAQRRTEPAPRPRPAAARAEPGAELPRQAGRRWFRISRPSMPAAGLITLSPAFLLLGSMFATIDLSTVAFATERGHRPLAGFILGTYALGSAAGGLWYGTRNWRAPLGHRFVATMAMTVAGVATFWIMPGLLALDAVVLVAGMAIAPTLIAGYGILERQAPPHRTTEGMAWLGSTISVGVALGSAVAGHVIDAGGSRWGFIYAACCGAAAVLIALTGLGRLSTRPEAQPAE